MKSTICLDFDGVCNLYNGWTGEDNLLEPRPGLDSFISYIITKLNKKVAIFSTRPPVKLSNWFVSNFPNLQDHINSGDLYFPDKKPSALYYIDACAIQFNGDFGQTIKDIDNFKVYWQK